MMRGILAALLLWSAAAAAQQTTLTVVGSEGVVALATPQGTVSGTTVTGVYAGRAAAQTAMATIGWRLSATPSGAPVLTVDTIDTASGVVLAETLGYGGKPASRTAPMGVYTGTGGYGAPGPANALTFAAWLGRKVPLFLDFFYYGVDGNAPPDNNGDSPAAAANGWGTMVRSAESEAAYWQAAGYTKGVFSIPAIPQSIHAYEMSASAPLAGNISMSADEQALCPTVGLGTPITVPGVATPIGSQAYDCYRWAMARSMVNHGFADSWIRLPWEFNALAKSVANPNAYGYVWACYGRPAADCINSDRRIVQVWRAAGWHGRSIWNVASSTDPLSTFDPESVYPGDDAVDSVGEDNYNVWYGGANATDAQRVAGRYGSVYPVGLTWVRNEAALHHKTVSLPEWGVGQDTHYNPDGSTYLSTAAANNGGRGDEPSFIYMIAGFVNALGACGPLVAGQSVAAPCFEEGNYWDASGPDGWHGLNDNFQYPLSRMALRAASGP